MLGSMLAFAQTRVITGRVVDEAGQPVSGASVLIKGSNVGASADANGTFKINAKTGDVLVVTAVGAPSREIDVTASSNLTISLARQSQNLSEVVVTTALGIQRQAKSLGYSTATVRSTELVQARPVNLQNGLTGKVSGLNIQTVNNGVFADTRITLRGIRSLTGNNQPMLILDGVPLALSYINSLNPNDVADVTILKSSSATAVYGPEGVNGAIVITTRKGNRSRPIITLSHTTQMETVSFMPKMQTRFGSGSSVDPFGYGVYDPVENQTYGDQFDGSMRQIGRDDPNGNKYMTEYIARPDEKRKFWNSGFTNQTDVSFSTGDFYVSAQNVDIKGITPRDENHRRNVRVSANKEYGRFRASFNMNYTNGNYDVTAGERFGNGRDFQPYWLLINTPMHIPLTRFKDWRNDYWASPNGFFSDYYSNPYWAIDNFRAVGRTNDLLGNVELNFKATDWLNLTYRIGGTTSSFTDLATQGALTYSDFAVASHKSIASSGNLKSAVMKKDSVSSRLSSELFATARKDFGQFRVDGLLGYNFRQTRTSSTGVTSLNLGIPTV
ncbi:MAG TPA: carboxypeptidase-like regulatory domain-containing protein, partial [Segetibacter sp.]